MIASVGKAPKFGPGRLVVDGTDTTVVRKAEFSFSPTARQAGRLDRLVAICAEVYNAGLQHRRDAWRMAGVSVSLFDQFGEIKDLRGVRDDALAFGIQPVRGALRRVDEAFAGFFRRLETGQKPGFPRFKSWRRYKTVSWDEPVSWKLDLDAGRLYVQGVGHIRLSKGALRQLHRLADRGGQARTLTVTRRRAGRHGWTWKATVAFTDVAARKTPAPNNLAGVDRGVAVTAAVSDGRLLIMPSFLAQVRDEIAELCRARDACRKGSRRWAQINRKIARVYSKAARRSDNWAREQAKAITADHDVIALEQLELKNMTRSARGTKEHPGKNVAAKQGLNRSLQDAALGRLAYRICVKAEEAGRRVWLVDPKHSSTSCADCGHTEAANRKTRDRFCCRQCGWEDHADTNASVVIAARGQTAEAAWQAKGAPLLTRPKPRLRRHTASPSQPELTPSQKPGAGPAPAPQGGTRD
jgi:putative transposase